MHTYDVKKNYDPNRKWSNYSADLDKYVESLYQKYGSSSYWDQLLSAMNPYLNTPVKPNSTEYWTDFVTTNNLEARKQAAQVIAIMREEERNKPLSQVEREREAGINPDLSGNINPGTASEATELPTTELPSMTDYMSQKIQQGNSIATAGMDFLQACFALAGNFQSLKAGSLANAGTEIDLYTKSDAFMQDFVASRMPVPTKEEAEAQQLDFGQAMQNALEKAQVDSSFKFGRKTKKYLKLITGTLRYGLNGKGSVGVADKYQKLANSFLTNRRNAAKVMGSIEYDDTFIKEISNISDFYSKLSYDVWTKQMDLQKKISEFQAKYYSEGLKLGVPQENAQLQDLQIENSTELEKKRKELGLPSLLAETETKQTELNKLVSEIERLRQETINMAESSWNDEMHRIEQSDSIWTPMLLMLLPFLRENMARSTVDYFNSALNSVGSRAISLGF